MRLNSCQLTEVAAAALLVAGALVILSVGFAVVPRAFAGTFSSGRIEVRGLVGLYQDSSHLTPFHGGIVTVSGMRGGKPIRNWQIRTSTRGTDQGAEFSGTLDVGDGGRRFDGYRFGIDAAVRELRCSPEGSPSCLIPARRASDGVLVVNIEAMQ